MSNRPLIKPKSAYTKRRLIIFFILCTIIAVSIMTGFSKGMNSDSTIYTADGERIVMWQELPTTGTPEDYDLLSNVKFTAQRIYISPYFRGVTSGKVLANIGMGIKYTQNVDNIRVVKGDTIFVQAISSSSLKSVAEQRYYIGDDVFLRPSVSVNGASATFADNISKFDKDDYYQAYGVIPNELTKLKIDDTTILSVRDDNAPLRSEAKNSDMDGDNTDGDAAVTFDVPQSLVPDADGNFSVTLELDPAESTKYSRNEVRTLASADQNPYYYSSSVTIKFTAEWKPISVTTVDNYDIAMPVLGAMNCSTTLTEYFYDIDDDGEIPEQEFFESRIDSIDPDLKPPTSASPADYLASAFAEYIDGTKNLDLVADIDIAGVALDGLSLSVNVGTMNVRAKLGNLAVEYAGDRVYITLNDIKGYFTVDKFASFMQDPALSAIIGGMKDKLPDFDSLLGGDILATVFGACEMTTDDGVTCIHMPFDLTEDISVDASLYIQAEDMKLLKISGTISAFGLDIKVDATPTTTTFPAIDETYKPLDGIVDFIPDAVGTATGTTYGINGTLAFNDYALDIDAYIERDDNGVTVDATLGAFGLNVGIKYIENDIYVSVGNIDIHATTDELVDVMSLLTDLTDFDIKKELGIDRLEKLLGITINLDSLDDIKKLLPQTVAEWIGTVRTLEVTDTSLDIGARLIGMPISIGLTRADGKLSGVKFGMDLIVFDKISRFSADLAVTSPDKKNVSAPDSYVELGALLDFVPTVQNLVAQKALSGDVALGIGNVTYNAKVALDFNDGLKARITVDALDAEVVVIAPALNDISSAAIYLKVADIKVYGTVSDIKDIITALAPALPDDIGAVVDTALGYLDMDMSGLSDISNVAGLINTALGAVRAVAQTSDGIAAKITAGGTTVDIELSSSLSYIKANTIVSGKEIAFSLDNVVFDAPTIGAIDGAVNISQFLPVIDGVLPYVNAKGITLDIYGTFDLGDDDAQTEITVSGTVTVALPLRIEANFNIADVKLDIVYDGQTVYVNIDNKLKLSCAATKDGISELLDDLVQALSGMEDIDGLDKVITSLGAAKDMISAPFEFDVVGMLKAVTLSEARDEASGMSRLTLGYKDVAVTFVAADGMLNAVELELVIDGKPFALSAAVGVDSQTGAIRSLEIVHDLVTVSVGIARDDNADVTEVDASEYTSVKSLIEYVRPIAELVSGAMNAKTVKLDIAAKLTLKSGNYIDIQSRDLTISIGETIGLSGQIVLFAGTGEDSETALTFTFADGVVYLKLGGIELKLDADTDIDRLLDIISSYLPDYLDTEMRKLLGKESGASAFSDISLIVEKIKALSSAADAREILSVLLSGYGGLSSDTTLKKLLSAVSLSTLNDRLTIGADLGFVYMTVSPMIAAGEVVGMTMTANVFGIDIYVAASNLSISEVATPITAPADGDRYVSIVDFAAIVHNLVGTFSQRADDGSITFEITDLDFTYAEKADDGTTVTVKNMDGQSALKGKFTPHTTPAETDGETVITPETTVYGVSLEMHVTIDIPTYAEKLGTIGFELYLFDVYPDSPLAYVNYTEFYGDDSQNVGELISIDADSVLQIIGAVMDIIGVKDDTVKKLLGNYHHDIDTELFDSMDIVGLDVLKAMLDGTAKAIGEVTLAMNDGNAALDMINNAGSVDRLRELLPEIKDKATSAVDHLKAAIDAYKGNADQDEDSDSDDETEETPIAPAAGSAIRGEKVKGITDGIAFTRGDGALYAEIDNTLTTGADGSAKITVYEADGTLTGFEINNLDVNTALIEGGAAFVSGKEVILSPVPTAPSYSTYSDLSTIKHLLFDVMNTANLMEFGIGGYDTSDSIDITLDLKNISGGALLQYLAKLDISIKYNIQVKLIDAGRDENGKTIYKTAALVELFYENCTASILSAKTQVIADCVTRLYFYDNVLYVQGVSDWGTTGSATVGTVDTLYTATRSWKSYSEEFTVDYVASTDNIERVNVMYTVDEFFYMISNDMSKFFNEFLFYLVPLSKNFTFLGLNLQEELVKLLPTSSGSGTENLSATIARIFKGYNYADGLHSIVIGLKELSGSDSMSDLNIGIVGQNNDDDAGDDGNLFNNYISNFYVDTTIQNGLVTLALSATLNNVHVTDRGTIESKGLAPADVTTVDSTFSHNGKTYIASYSNYQADTLYTLDGTLYAAADGSTLYTDHGKLVQVYRTADASDSYSTTSSTCNVDKPSDAGYKFGDTFWQYKHTYNLDGVYCLNDKYDYQYYVGTNADSSRYIYRLDGNDSVPVALKSVTGDLLAEVITVDGKIVAVNNRGGGVQWSRPWQAAYEASLAA